MKSVDLAKKGPPLICAICKAELKNMSMARHYELRHPGQSLPPSASKTSSSSPLKATVCSLCRPPRSITGRLIEHLQEHHPSPHPIRVRKSSTLPRRQKYVWGAGIVKLSDESGGRY